MSWLDFRDWLRDWWFNQWHPNSRWTRQKQQQVRRATRQLRRQVRSDRRQIRREATQ